MQSVKREVVFLSKLSKKARLDGVVSSPGEVKYIREAMGNDFVIVVPGVRPTWAEVNDHRRVATPAEAVSGGADYIVVGRPITKARNPFEAANRIREEII